MVSIYAIYFPGTRVSRKSPGAWGHILTKASKTQRSIQFPPLAGLPETTQKLNEEIQRPVNLSVLPMFSIYVTDIVPWLQVCDVPGAQYIPRTEA